MRIITLQTYILTGYIYTFTHDTPGKHLQLFLKLLTPEAFTLQTFNRYLAFNDHWPHDQRKPSGCWFFLYFISD